jgi:glucose/arabinose dehydrogenase
VPGCHQIEAPLGHNGAVKTTSGRRSMVVMTVVGGLFASSCAALTPATDGRASDTPTTSTLEQDDSQATEPSETATTLELPDPLWQQLDLELVPIAELEEPIAFAARSGSLNYYVAERAGRIMVIQRTINDSGRERVTLSNRPLLDITEIVSVAGEGGLLGLAFSSDGRQVFVSYTDLAGDLVITEYLASLSDQADLDTARELLRVPQPFENHNGGTIAIGDDGFLYIGLGDGGGSGDPQESGQDLDSLLGKVLRIDPFADSDGPYSIPDSNPFAIEGGRSEIWLWGVRNPWKFSFDTETGDLWLPDVGQDTTEEINLLRANAGGGRGANLGWSLVEGDNPFEGRTAPTDHTGPTYVYDHDDRRCSITGGAVYRGALIALLQAVYVFGDFCSGEIFGLQILPEGLLVRPLPVRLGENQLASFGEGPDGELLVLERTGPNGIGVVYRVEPAKAEDTSG